MHLIYLIPNQNEVPCVFSALHFGLQFYDDINVKRMQQKLLDWKYFVLVNKYVQISKALDAQPRLSIWISPSHVLARVTSMG